MEWLLDQGVTSADVGSAVQVTAECGHVAATRLLLHRGADLSSCGIQALYCALERGSWEIVQLLMEAGLQVNVSQLLVQLCKADDGNDVPESVLQHHTPRLYRMLQAQVFYALAEQLVAAIQAIINAGNVELANLLVEIAAKVSVVDVQGMLSGA
jgi:hypothetical protein